MGRSFKKLYTNKEDFIAYKNQNFHKNKKTLIWFGGLNSDMDGTKAIFLSNLSTSLYSSFNILIIGLLTNDTLTGVYASFEKIILALIFRRRINAESEITAEVH